MFFYLGPCSIFFPSSFGKLLLQQMAILENVERDSSVILSAWIWRQRMIFIISGLIYQVPGAEMPLSKLALILDLISADFGLFKVLNL